MDQTLAHGSTLALNEARPVRLLDRHGTVAWTLEWSERGLDEAQLRLPYGGWVRLAARSSEHPLFGPCDTVRDEQGRTRGRMAAVDWQRPRSIPPVDVPGALPSGSGTVLLNLLALLSRLAEVPSLRYIGPYPTATLFDALTQSFIPRDGWTGAAERFTHEVESTMLAGLMREVPVDFEPRPHELTWPRPGVCVQLREGVERIVVDGCVYSRLQRGHRTVVVEGDRATAQIELAGRPWCRVLTVGPTGDVLEGPHPMPEPPANLVDEPLPEPVREVLTEILIARAPTLLRTAIQDELTQRTLTWGATGADLAREAPGRLMLHAELGARLPELDPHAMLATLVEALDPLVTRLAARSVANRR